jgi:tripeptide aminopeptidase
LIGGRRRQLSVLFLALAALLPAQGLQTPDLVSRLLQDPAVKAALEAAKNSEAATLADQVRLSEIPAPSFKEGKRGVAVLQIFNELGLRNTRIDKAGNVVGERPGRGAHPNLVFAAHLDTVFPEGTDVKVTRQSTVLKGPGIGDDARGLAVLIAVARTLNQAKVQTPGTITFVADVGEEGLGDLRGMKQLFDETLKGQIDLFMSVDGSGSGITHLGVGSYRYRVTYQGPGGHSYGAFGLANPIHALGRAIAGISELQVPKTPKTTFNVGRIGGGTSVNSIAGDAWMEMDMRSVDMKELKVLEAGFLKAVDQALVAENGRWGDKGKLTVHREKIGDRPAGNTPENSPIVQTAIAVTKALGLAAPLGDGSTDANYPMNLHIPAITIGGGGNGVGAHSLGESFDTAGSWQGTQRALLLVIALVQSQKL